MFYSDNVTRVCPEVWAAMQAVDRDDAIPYGGDAVTARLNERFSEFFEAPVRVFPVATGIAANALSLSLATPPHGTVLCHERAHIHTTECGAVEQWSGGARLTLLPGEHGRLDPAEVGAFLAAWNPARPQALRPAAVSLTQGTEAGTVYPLSRIAEIAGIARKYGLSLHMDGARFANALAALGCTPAELTWKAGVDVLSFGATKNGGMCADAVVVFRPELAEGAGQRRVRGGQLFSKMRYLSAQLEAMVSDGLCLSNARQANRMAKRLADGLAGVAGVTLAHPVEINEVFATLPDAAVAGLAREGIKLVPRPTKGGILYRLVCAWDTPAERVDRFIETVARFAKAA
ncbi:MAG: low specificity L-threonine aldolase [Proteobacteria bacterium]|nr:low specificity L-threonine aldolase [Pseudomonadota bacterium]